MGQSPDRDIAYRFSRIDWHASKGQIATRSIFFFSEKNPPSLPIFSTSISNLISIYKRLFHFIIYIGLLYLTFIHWNNQLIIVENIY